MLPNPKPAIVLLAAGGSRRMGQIKQLIPWQGKPLLQHALDQLKGLHSASLTLVLGSEAETILPKINLGGAEVLIHSGWEEGLASSIRSAVAVEMAKPIPATALLIVLADQPRLTTSHYQQMLEVHQVHPGKIIAAHYGGRYGVPMIFPAAYFAELMAMKGDRGAGQWVNGLSSGVVALPLPEAREDWDRPEDLPDGIG